MNNFLSDIVVLFELVLQTGWLLSRMLKIDFPNEEYLNETPTPDVIIVEIQNCFFTVCTSNVLPSGKLPSTSRFRSPVTASYTL